MEISSNFLVLSQVPTYPPKSILQVRFISFISSILYESLNKKPNLDNLELGYFPYTIQ